MSDYDNIDGIFTINPVTGELTVIDSSNLDFETLPTSYVLGITVSDGTNTSAVETVTVTVTNVNEAPTDLGLSAATVAENAAGAVIGNVSVTDPDAGGAHTYTVDDVRFEVVGGQLKLVAGQSLNFEAEPTVDVIITAPLYACPGPRDHG